MPLAPIAARHLSRHRQCASGQRSPLDILLSAGCEAPVGDQTQSTTLDSGLSDRQRIHRRLADLQHDPRRLVYAVRDQNTADTGELQRGQTYRFRHVLDLYHLAGVSLGVLRRAEQ